MGHIIPAGTGYHYHRSVQLKPLVELEEEAPMVEAPPAPAAEN